MAVFLILHPFATYFLVYCLYNRREIVCRSWRTQKGPPEVLQQTFMDLDHLLDVPLTRTDIKIIWELWITWELNFTCITICWWVNKFSKSLKYIYHLVLKFVQKFVTTLCIVWIFNENHILLQVWSCTHSSSFTHYLRSSPVSWSELGSFSAAVPWFTTSSCGKRFVS